MGRRAIKVFLILLGLVASLIAIGCWGFVAIERMSPAEAFSATVNILSTVGLGAFPASNWQGRILVGFLQLGSVSIVALAIASLSEVMMRGALRQYLGRYRMDERISSLTDHFIIVGHSLTGESLISDLSAEGQPFVIVERDPETIIRIGEKNLLYVEGDATDEDVLRKAGVERARGLFAVLSQDSDNLMVVLSARGMNESLNIVSRSTREDYVKRFLRAGANAAISPQEWASRRMIQAVLRPHLLELLSTLLDPAIAHAYLDEARVPEGSPSIGKTLLELDVRARAGIVILGIMRANGEHVCSPGPDSAIQEGDVLVGFGRRENFASLSQIMRGENVSSPLPAERC